MTEFFFVIFRPLSALFFEAFFLDRRSMDRWRDLAHSGGGRKPNKRFRSALAAHWSASSQEKRIGSVAARCVASRRLASEWLRVRRVTLAVSAACALSPLCASPLLSSPLRFFLSRFSSSRASAPLSPFRDLVRDLELAFESSPRSLHHARAHFFLPRIRTFRRPIIRPARFPVPFIRGINRENALNRERRNTL